MADGTPPPARTRATLAILGGMLIAAGLLVSPAALISLGPMRQSLTSEKPLVRQTALLEVNVARGLFVAAGAVLIWMAVQWDKVRRSRIVRWIADDSPRYQIRAPGTVNLSLVLMCAGFLISLAYLCLGPRLLPASLRASINGEDGWVEQTSAALFALACVLALIVAFRTRWLPQRVTHLVLALGFFVCCGEEISWGQRIFGFETPDSFQAVNVQDEFNIHNLFGYAADHVFIAGIFAYGVVLPVVVHRNKFWRNLFGLLGLPVASLGLAAGFLLASLYHEWIIDRVIVNASGIRVAELRELSSAWGLVLLMVETMRLGYRQEWRLPEPEIEEPAEQRSRRRADEAEGRTRTKRPRQAARPRKSLGARRK